MASLLACYSAAGGSGSNSIEEILRPIRAPQGVSLRPAVQAVQAAAESAPSVSHIAQSIYSWITPLITVLYVLSPLDVIPDVIPLMGWLDDIVVIIAFMVWLRSLARRQRIT